MATDGRELIDRSLSMFCSGLSECETEDEKRVELDLLYTDLLEVFRGSPTERVLRLGHAELRRSAEADSLEEALKTVLD